MCFFLGLFLNLLSPLHLSHSNEMEYDFSASMFRTERASNNCATNYQDKHALLFFL
jgi:hypothetical protein